LKLILVSSAESVGGTAIKGLLARKTLEIFILAFAAVEKGGGAKKPKKE